jgi:phosphoenolpyruvate carboxykinase (diphosphate)
MELERSLGLTAEGGAAAGDRKRIVRGILFRLAAMGHVLPETLDDEEALLLGRDLLARYREQTRLLSAHLSPADQRIQGFIDRLLEPLELAERPRLPASTFILDRHGVARELAFPLDEDSYHNEHVSSYRTAGGGVLHNPTNDRRTTAGVFHIAQPDEAGLPVPADKTAVPLPVFARLLQAALDPPADLRRLPFASRWPRPIEIMTSLLIRPLVCPAVPERMPEKRMEVRLFAPGGLVSNLDFVESVFGNAGDPFLPENDAGLDAAHWTGHSGCVILAPHLTRLRKKDLGLPPLDQATHAQRASGMCWSQEHELYNEGKPFKIAARDLGGVMVTLISDNYFGYCKKEVKTQISYAANLYGLAEEEHAGGALAFPASSVGDHFVPDARVLAGGHRFVEALALLGDSAVLHPSGHATDRRYPSVHYLPEDMEIDLHRQDISWTSRGEEQHLKLLPGHIYLHPSGYKLRMEKHPAAPSWRLIRTAPEGTLCHKPCTVSGGGKSEISKSLSDAVLYGPIHVKNFAEDMALVQEIFARDYRERWLPGRGPSEGSSRPVLSVRRSLGSVIKLLTPNDLDFTPAYNDWLRRIPNHIRALVFIIKRFHQPDWTDWRPHFSVDVIDGEPAHELKYAGRRLVGSYLRVGSGTAGAWRTFKLRQDFVPADKVQVEDDITASVVVPANSLPGLPADLEGHASLKLVANCELRLFQRPDDAVTPGLDRQAEADLAEPGAFASNFQPLRGKEVQQIVEDVSLYDRFTPPMQAHLAAGAARTDGYTVCSARPRLVAGKPTKNPRYLQTRPDLARPRDRYVAEQGARLQRRLPCDRPVIFPVQSVLGGRRNNPPEKGVRPLCVYGPIHYQELPELFMDYCCSVTGRSPSTTGAGSEGALTKGPFNALSAIADLNNALCSMILCGYAGFSTTAGWIGPHHPVGHDLSVLIPELWCRLTPEERDPARMIAQGHLEKLEDFDQGRLVLASRLGYRITARFVRTYFGRIFDKPAAVFTEEMLKPELQDPAVFADAMDNIVTAQQRAARALFEEGSTDDASPPLRALLQIMAHGVWENGKTAAHPEFRALFTRESLLASRWYRDRLATKQSRDVALWQRHVRTLAEFLELPGHQEEAERLGIPARLDLARRELERVTSRSYLAEIDGTIGADPIHRTRDSARLGEAGPPRAGEDALYIVR